MSDAYEIGKLIAATPWSAIAKDLDAASEALVRVDERMARDPTIAEGFQSRGHFREACAALWLEGELVHLEDLVLHDASMDIRAPTTEVVRSASILRARRAICRHDARWPLSEAGLAILRGRKPKKTDLEFAASEDGDHSEVDALIERSDRAIENAGMAALQRAGLFLEDDWDEDAKLAEWLSVVRATAGLPPLLAAAFAWDAWLAIEPYRRHNYLGIQLVAALLRERGKTGCHLTTINLGIRSSGYRRKAREDLPTRLLGFLRSTKAAADAGLRELTELGFARQRMEARLKGRRSSSRLPELIQLFLSSPIVSVPAAAKNLKVSPQAVEGMIKVLGPSLPREITGRARYRAWGIF